MEHALKAASVAVFLLTSAAWGQQAPGADQASSSDQHFIDSALQSELAVGELSDLMVQKGQNADIKQLAQQLSQSAKSDEKALSDIAQHLRGKPTDVKPSAEALAQKNRLDQMSGADFDHQYLQMMINRHVQDVHDFQLEAQDGQNGEIKSFAQKTLPTLQHDLSQAESLDQQVFKAAAASGSGEAPTTKTWPLDVSGAGEKAK